MGVGISTVVPNADAAGPVVSLVFFILVALSGLYFPVRPGSGLATFTGFFPVRHLILAMVDSFNGIPSTSVWNDLLVVAIWGAVGCVRQPAALGLVAQAGVRAGVGGVLPCRRPRLVRTSARRRPRSPVR